jgi:tRNA modification GTPase
MTEDTIAAISTPLGEAGIAIIRVSGPQALAIADELFVGRQGKPSTFPSHTIHYGRLKDGDQTVDHVMLSVLRAPHSYTTEDTVEINCHGGLLICRRVLQLCLQHGARQAEPGEFTKRAFLNGRLDLTQAEAVMDLISSKSERARQAAGYALEGYLSKRVESLRDQLMTVLAHIEAQIDFPEDDIPPASRANLIQNITEIITALKKLLATAHEGKILRHGVTIAIIGRPNAGKSSLMNVLLGEDRSIVTPIAGTTRDTIEEFATIRGIPVRLIDTAGIRSARGLIEGIGISRTLKTLERSDLAIHIIDGSKKLNNSDKVIMNLCPHNRTIVAINKVDLKSKIARQDIIHSSHHLNISCAKEIGIDRLKDQIEEIVYSGSVHGGDSDVFVNDRHADALRRGLLHIETGLKKFSDCEPLEIIAQEYRAGLSVIGEIVGKTSTEDLLSKIFSTFCIGK